MRVLYRVNINQYVTLVLNVLTKTAFPGIEVTAVPLLPGVNVEELNAGGIAIICTGAAALLVDDRTEIGKTFPRLGLFGAAEKPASDGTHLLLLMLQLTAVLLIFAGQVDKVAVTAGRSWYCSEEPLLVEVQFLQHLGQLEPNLGISQWQFYKFLEIVLGLPYP